MRPDSRRGFALPLLGMLLLVAMAVAASPAASAAASDGKQCSDQKINFADKLKLFQEHWTPKVIAEMNDYQFKLVKVSGEFVWHEHPDTDEAFIVLDGELWIDLEGEAGEAGEERPAVALSRGEMYVVPKGVSHRPRTAGEDAECHLLLIEPTGVVNTGEVEDSGLHAPNDVWI